MCIINIQSEKLQTTIAPNNYPTDLVTDYNFQIHAQKLIHKYMQKRRPVLAISYLQEVQYPAQILIQIFAPDSLPPR